MDTEHRLAILAHELGISFSRRECECADFVVESIGVAVCVAEEKPCVVRALLAKGANPNLAIGAQTPLRAAFENPEITQLLINAGAKP
jgi:hypothetical protein